jgi:DNA modification methylase
MGESVSRHFPEVELPMTTGTNGASCQGPVECLGMTFASEEARRAYFLEILREKLQDAEFRATPGFPRGTDEDILALSDPPWFTACPNPFARDFVLHYGKPNRAPRPHARGPHPGDLRSSTRHPVYAFHPYHTKVPPEIIRTLIEQCTVPGDLVLDGFGGSGMTGVAAREAGRHAIVCDLSPVAGFIAGVNCRGHDVQAALRCLRACLAASEERWGHFYHTKEQGQLLRVNYYVWCDVFTCPTCTGEFPFFPHGVIHHGKKVETRRAFPCPHCGAELNVRRVERVLTAAGKKRSLAWVNAGMGTGRINRVPNRNDVKLAEQIEAMSPAAWCPTDPIDPDGYSARLAQLGDKAITDVSRFLSRRNLIIFADLWERVSGIGDSGLRNVCRATLTSIFTVVSERQGYFGGGGGMSGNLYMPIVRMEKNIYDTLRRKLLKLAEAERAKDELRSQVLVATQSTTRLSSLPDESIDYIFTDPPFGPNIIYSEMNAILEGWLRVQTNDRLEAVIDRSRQRDFEEYTSLLRSCFGEYYRLLKPGRWLTVEFHNTAASVWNLLQQVLGESGFVIEQVSVFDKGSTTILADIRQGTVRGDLLISAHKPTTQAPVRFQLQRGSVEGVWELVQQYLAQLGVGAEERAQRSRYVLFDRMVAFHVQRNLSVPLSAAEFYAGLRERFPEREEMYFLPEQVVEHNSLLGQVY